MCLSGCISFVCAHTSPHTQTLTHKVTPADTVGRPNTRILPTRAPHPTATAPKQGACPACPPRQMQVNHCLSIPVWRALYWHPGSSRCDRTVGLRGAEGLIFFLLQVVHLFVLFELLFYYLFGFHSSGFIYLSLKNTFFS